MALLFLIEKQQNHPIFERFNALYGDSLVNYYPLLSKFKINIFTVQEYKTLSKDIPQIDDIEEHPFANYIKNDNGNMDSTVAGIVFSEGIIQSLGFNEEEQFAAIAHEIGHIIFFFLDNKNDYPGSQGEEIFADGIASKIGLGKQMLDAILKLEKSGMYSNPLSRFGMRKMWLNV